MHVLGTGNRSSKQVTDIVFRDPCSETGESEEGECDVAMLRAQKERKEEGSPR
jgi:hypothetical protein